MSRNLANPYRPFFFVGYFAALVGAGVWITHPLVPGHPYPGRLHAHLMMGVFLLSYAVGFLLTALPRLTRTSFTHRYEFLGFSLLMGWIALVGVYDPTERSFFAGTTLVAALLFVFGWRRIKRAGAALPDFFPMLFWGWFSLFAGSLLTFTEQGSLGEALFYQNFMLCLALGIGVFLVPKILDYPVAPRIRGRTAFFLIGLTLTLSLVAVELGVAAQAAYARAFVASFVVLFGWNIFTKAARKSILGSGIRLAAWMMLGGLWGLAVFPEYRLESLHVLYVGGFAVLTLMVASRVILSHGNYDLTAELKNAHIKYALCFFSLAAATRAAAVFVPNGYEKHLAYASAAFIAGAVVWGRYFLTRIFENFGQHDQSRFRRLNN